MAPVVLGLLTLSGGGISGAIVKDMALANALRRRGYPTVVYWMYGRTPGLLERGVRERLVCGPGTTDPQAFLRRVIDDWCDGAAQDPGVVPRLRGHLDGDGITHLLPTLTAMGGIVRAVQQAGPRPFSYVPTFQGEEIFAFHAARFGRLGDFTRMLRDSVAGAAGPTVVVSHDYKTRISGEFGIDPADLTVIYPGMTPAGEVASEHELFAAFPGLRPDLPIVAYVGRQDAEKGVDLLLYAVKILAARGVACQLVLCGSSGFGDSYRITLERIAGYLLLPVHHRGEVTAPIRDALYARSRCVVYPAIHGEPFGLVPAEAMRAGTPAVVPDWGGVTEVVSDGHRRGGVTFRAWDSGDLAARLEELLVDDQLHAGLAAEAPSLAARFDVETMCDAYLDRLGLPHQAAPRPAADRA